MAVDAHSSLGASGAYRWTICTAQPAMTAGIPNPSGFFAAEGTVGHNVAELCFTKNKNAYDYIGESFNEDVEGELKEFIVDNEMAEAVQVYVNHVRELSLGCQLHIEQRVDLSRLYPGMFGTVDCWFVRNGVLIVRDYKHGKYKGVEVENNLQLAYYAIGAYFKAYELGYQVNQVDVGIVQPRYPHEEGPIRSTTLTIDQLNQWSNFLAEKARETFENPQLVAGSHCHWCVAKSCRARALMQINLCTLEQPISELTDSECERFLDHMSALKSGFDLIHSTILERMKVGKIKSKNWKLVNTSPRASVKDIDNFYEALPLIGFDATDFQKKEPPKPVSRTQAKKIAGDQFDLIDPFYHKPEPGITLVPISDKRQAISPKSTEDMLAGFKDITVPPAINKGDQHG